RPRARCRARHGEAARREKALHDFEHRNELSGLRAIVRGTRSAAVFIQLAAWLVRSLPRLWRGLGDVFSRGERRRFGFGIRVARGKNARMAGAARSSAVPGVRWLAAESDCAERARAE